MSEQVIQLTENYATLNWRFRRGTTFFREFAFRQRDCATGVKTPIDLDDSDFSAVIKTRRGVTTDTLTISDGITIFGDDNEKIRLHRDAETTAEWPSDCDLTLTLTWTRPTTPEIVKDIIVATL